MATVILSSSSQDSLWDKIKDEKYTNSDHWGSSNGPGWRSGRWNENAGWGSSSGGRGSATGKAREWGSREGGWGSSREGWATSGETSGWGSTESAWTNRGSGHNGSKKPSSLKCDAVPESSLATNSRLQSGEDRKEDGSTGWGSGNGGWGVGTGTSIWAQAAHSGEEMGGANAKNNVSPLFAPVVPPKSPERSGWGTHTTPSSNTQAQLNPNALATSPSQPCASASASQPSSQLYDSPQVYHFRQSHFTALGDGSSEYRSYPGTYDIRAMWESNYIGHYTPMDFSASPSTLQEGMDRNMERYYWDLRYQSKLSDRSPYVQEMQDIPEKHRQLFFERLAHIDFMFSRVERKMRPSVASSSELQSASPKDFLNQHDREVKRTVYKALRLLYKEWHNGAEYPSALDWEGDHSMPYRTGPMIG